MRAALVLLAIVPAAARAHVGGSPSPVFFDAPRGVQETADASYTVRFADNDADLTSEEVFYAVRGAFPLRPGPGEPALIGPLFGPVQMNDPDSTFVWDTSKVPEGAYTLVARVQDSFNGITYWYPSHGTLAVVHGGVRGPGLVLLTPYHCAQADRRYTIAWDALDPAGAGGTVDLYYGWYGTPGEALTPIATRLPVCAGSFDWDSSGIPSGRVAVYGIFRGPSGVAFAAAGDWLWVEHPPAGPPPGCSGAAPGFDAGSASCPTGADGGDASDGGRPAPPRQGCGCGENPRLPLAVGCLRFFLTLRSHPRRRREAMSASASAPNLRSR